MKTIEQIRQTPLSRRTVTEEYALARYEHRQPYCVYCESPLSIEQTQYTYLDWYWDEKSDSYVKNDYEGDSEKPYCLQCETKDWDFIVEDMVAF